MGLEEENGKIYITELPKGYDASRIYKYLGKHIEKDYIKDFVDSSVDNDIKIEIIFKRGKTPPLDEVQKKLGASSSLTPNYTLISEKGVRIFNRAEEIIEIFTEQRLKIVKRRYELFCDDLQHKINQNNEIIRFIKEKQYEKATKSKNRKTYVDYLGTKKFKFADYLADMPIYRMTKDEVERRILMVRDDKKKFAEYKKIAGSQALIKKKLIEELEDVKAKLTEVTAKRDMEKKKLYAKTGKNGKASKGRRKVTRH